MTPRHICASTSDVIEMQNLKTGKRLVTFIPKTSQTEKMKNLTPPSYNTSKTLSRYSDIIAMYYEKGFTFWSN